MYYTSSYVSSRSISTQCAPAVLSPAGMDPQPDGAGSLCGAGPYRRGSHGHVLADDRYNMHPAHAYACHACSWSRHNRLCSSSRGACGEFLAAIPGAGSMLGDDEFVDALQRSHRPPQGHRSTSPWPRKNTTARTNHRKNPTPQEPTTARKPQLACTVLLCQPVRYRWAARRDQVILRRWHQERPSFTLALHAHAEGLEVRRELQRVPASGGPPRCLRPVGAGRCPVGASRCPVGAGQLKVRSAQFERS